MFPRLIPLGALESFQLTHFLPELVFTLEDDGYGLDPVQCISFYQALRGRRVHGESLPIRAVESLGGWTWRREEPSRLSGPTRAVEFARVEHVFLGRPEEVRAIRRSVCNSLCAYLECLEVSYRVVVGEGCMDLPGLASAIARAQEEDDVPVLDIEIPLPGLGKVEGEAADHSGYAEISGCSVEGDRLCDRFDVRASDGASLWSGCCGIGMNRLLVGFLFQHGFDQRYWPAAV